LVVEIKTATCQAREKCLARLEKLMRVSHNPLTGIFDSRLLLELLLGLGALIWLAWAGPANGLTAPLDPPTPTLTSTPLSTSVPGTGAIAGTAWQDLDGDGTRGADEPPLAGLLLSLYDQGGQLLMTATTAADGGYRFAVLSPGLYQLVATAPANYLLTTSDTFNLFVSPGAVLMLDFGARPEPTPTITPTRLPTLDIDNAPFAFCGGLIRGDTRAGVNNVSRYACQPAWDERGPELVYRIELGRSQLLTAALLTTTADLDLFLLPSAYPESCLAAGDNYLSYRVQPGVYFLAVDGYEGAAGSFDLRLECPYGPQATATPTPTLTPEPSPTFTFTPGPTPSPTAAGNPRQRFLPMLLSRYPRPTPEPVTLTFQQGVNGYTGTADTTLNAWEPTRACGDEELLRLRYDRPPGVTAVMDPLLRFDLALLPAEAHIVHADLKLYLVTPPKYDLRGELHGLLRAWDEHTATWQQPATGQSWAEAGAQGVGTDHMGWVADDQFVEAGGRWYGFDVTELVQIWVGDPGNNYGLILLAQPGNSQSSVEAGFASREYADPTLRPQLTVSYWLEGALR
jgi:hypothetical protein